MGKNIFLVLLTIYLMTLSPAFSKEDGSEFVFDWEDSVNEEADNSKVVVEPLIEALKKDYGFMSVKKLSYSKFELTFSILNTEVEKMLTTVVSNGWYPESLSIISATKEKVAIVLSVSTKQNDSFRRFRVLQKLSYPGVLTWKIGKIDNKDAYVTSIQTDFGTDFIVKGETIKSGLIFKNLTPKISRVGADLENLDSERFKSNKTFDRKLLFTRETYEDNDTGINGQPFFERGTYKEDPVVGRYMEFTIRCQW